MLNNETYEVRVDNEGNVVFINVMLKSISDIYKSFGYLEYNNRSLNKGLEAYIFDSVKNHPLNKNMRLVIHIPEGKNQKECNNLRQAIFDHFKYKANETELYLKQRFKQWRINMLIGMLFLILCLILVEIFNGFSEIRIIKIAKESLVIIGWVALWEPLTFILFGWRQIKMDKLYYEKVCNVPVIVVKYISRSYSNRV